MENCETQNSEFENTIAALQMSGKTVREAEENEEVNINSLHWRERGLGGFETKVIFQNEEGTIYARYHRHPHRIVYIVERTNAA